MHTSQPMEADYRITEWRGGVDAENVICGFVVWIRFGLEVGLAKVMSHVTIYLFD